MEKKSKKSEKKCKIFFPPSTETANWHEKNVKKGEFATLAACVGFRPI
jgi:hypothetical protein